MDCGELSGKLNSSVCRNGVTPPWSVWYCTVLSVDMVTHRLGLSRVTLSLGSPNIRAPQSMKVRHPPSPLGPHFVVYYESFSPCLWIYYESIKRELITNRKDLLTTLLQWSACKSYSTVGSNTNCSQNHNPAFQFITLKKLRREGKKRACWNVILL